MKENKQKQVLGLGQLGWSLRRIEKETGIRRETAAAYLKAAGIAVREPGRWGRKPSSAKAANEVTAGQEPPATGGDQAKAANGVTTGPESGKGSPSLCEPYRETIGEALRQGRNATSIHQELVDRHGFAGSYQSVKRFARRLLGDYSPQARAIIQTAPGEEAQVDYGKGPRILDPATGSYRHCRLFVMTLGYSRKSVFLLAMRSSTRIWCELHQNAFGRLGGATRVIVLDNLAEGVLKPDVYDPAINPLFGDFLAHYNVVPLPCRVGDPDRKGKVESGVAYAKAHLRGKQYESLEQAQAELDHWERRWADLRIHGSTKRQVAAAFAEEKAALQPLPVEPFRFYQHGHRKVHLDGCVEVEAAYYSVPPGFIGQTVPVRWDNRSVRILHPNTGLLLREHLPQKRGKHRLLPEDRPGNTPPQVLNLLDRARRAGPHTGRLCESMHAARGAAAVRRIQGIIAFHRKYGQADVEHACATANEAGVNDYALVRRLLERHAAPPVSLRQVDPLIRELTAYRDLIQQRIAGPSAEPRQKELFDESN